MDRLRKAATNPSTWPCSSGSKRMYLPNSAITSIAALLQQLRHQRGPTRLMTRSEPFRRIAVEVLIEQNIVPKIWIRLKLLIGAEHRPAALVVSQKHAREAPR